MKTSGCKVFGARSALLFLVLTVFLPRPVTATILDARMTGGGSIFIGEMRVTHGFELHCSTANLPNNLEINWEGNRFHLTSLDSVTCVLVDDPKPPVAPFNTMFGSGTGRYNGQDGCTIEFFMTDKGEPGNQGAANSDEARFFITCPVGGSVLGGGNELTFGNHQAHK